jgi:hypothetical protein
MEQLEDLKSIIKRYSWFNKLIESIQETYSKLGHGLLETVYQKSIEAHLHMKNIKFSQEHTLDYFVNLSNLENEIKNNINLTSRSSSDLLTLVNNSDNDRNNVSKQFKVGVGRCDIMIENQGILEIKAQKTPELREEDIRQLQNYLIHSNLKIGVCVNFTKLPLVISPESNSVSYFKTVILIHSSEFQNTSSSSQFPIYYKFNLKIPMKLPSIHFPPKLKGNINFESLL